jgi:transposase
MPRRPGKQPGAAGAGRTQALTAHALQEHRPTVCAGCGQALAVDLAAQAYNGFQSVDLRLDDPAAPGMVLRVTDHRLLEVRCSCGHGTRAEPARSLAEPGVSDVELSEWRLVEPGLATLIAALSMRFRLSRARIVEFLDQWLGLKLSVGTIHQSLLETAATVAPAEDELVEAVLASKLLHADETPWPEQGRTLWLWVFCSSTVVLYYIAHRGRELLDALLPGFAGWLMTDGWVAYRAWPRRLRCWPHLIRKACGLSESRDRIAQAFGNEVLAVFERLIKAIHAARAGPRQPPVSIADVHADDLRALREACQRQNESPHEKTRALAVELLNDWAAIFQVLANPILPISNNDAERMLRHWVILRQLSHGTRTEQGSRYFALLASVIDTCRLRGHSPWRYLEDAIKLRRAGKLLPALPA